MWSVGALEGGELNPFSKGSLVSKSLQREGVFEPKKWLLLSVDISVQSSAALFSQGSRVPAGLGIIFLKKAKK